jgi:hypothetical protein
MSYDYRARKIVIVLSTSIDAGVAANVVGHLCVSLGARHSADLMGRHPLLDASGTPHCGIARYPIIITKTKPTRLRQLIEEARAASGVTLIDYPEEMLVTGHDDELASAIASKAASAFTYHGALILGNAPEVTELTGKFSLYR